MGSKYSASYSAIGYIYQIRYALYMLFTEKSEVGISVEALDDIVVDRDAKDINLVQVKNTSKDFKENSVDVWKTLRIWSEYIKQNKINLKYTKFVLIAKSNVMQNSLLSILKLNYNKTEKELKDLENELTKIATKSQNHELSIAYSNFLSLTLTEKLDLLDNIQILDGSIRLLDIPNEIKTHYLKYAVKQQYLDPLFNDVEGWWFERICYHLESKSSEPIYNSELSSLINERSQLYSSDNLPHEYLDYFPVVNDEPNVETRNFVKQLIAISIENEEIGYAIRDYYKASEYRARWTREGLLFPGELNKYEERLVDEWKRYAARCRRKYNLTVEDELIKCGVEIYDWTQTSSMPELQIRSKFTSAFFRRGSYHKLADKEPTPEIHWHPEFINRLKQILLGSSTI